MSRPPRRVRLAVAAGALGAALLLAGAPVAGESEGEGDGRYRPTREDYEAFRARHPDILEPNYLPFMVYRVPARAVPAWEHWLGPVARWLGREAPGERLVFCRWAEEDLPLRVHVEAPEIEEHLQVDELEPRRPAEYVRAVERALAIWERDLEGRIGFRRVEDPSEAQLRIRVVGGVAPVPDPNVRVLGSTRLADSCRVVGGDAASGRLEVRYRVEELRIFIADPYGLLLPGQVERVALHELGHALGMRGHSPIPADLMYEVARDRLPPEGLGAEDVNSFLSLYELPNGTVFLDPAERSSVERRVLPPDTPRLEIAPHVDARLGFEVQLPEGWMRIPTPYGVIAVNGTPWDYDASVQVIVRRFARVEEYLRLHGPAHVGGAEILGWDRTSLRGMPAVRVQLARRRGTREELVFLETGDGRVAIVIAECPAGLFAAYEPWFDAVLGSLEIVRRARPPADRDYHPRRPGGWERVPPPSPPAPSGPAEEVRPGAPEPGAGPGDPGGGASRDSLAD